MNKSLNAKTVRVYFSYSCSIVQTREVQSAMNQYNYVLITSTSCTVKICITKNLQHRILRYNKFSGYTLESIDYGSKCYQRYGC